MSLTFYNCSDPPNKLGKNLGTSLGTTTYFKPFYQSSELAPQYVLDQPLPSGANYVYDSFTGRYYFITDITHDIAKTTTISCSLDPLKSFSSRLTGNFYFVRGAAEVNEMEDASYPLSDYIKTETFYFDDWNDGFFKNTDGSEGGKRYMLRVAHGDNFDDEFAVEVSVGEDVTYEGEAGRVLSITSTTIKIQLGLGSGGENIDSGSFLKSGSGVIYYYDSTTERTGITSVIFKS